MSIQKNKASGDRCITVVSHSLHSPSSLQNPRLATGGAEDRVVGCTHGLPTSTAADPGSSLLSGGAEEAPLPLLSFLLLCCWPLLRWDIESVTYEATQLDSGAPSSVWMISLL